MPTTSTTTPATAALIKQCDWGGLVSRIKADPGVLDEVLVALELEKEKAESATKEVGALKSLVAHLEHRLALLQHRMFGRRSERMDLGQLLLFGAEAPPAESPAAPEPTQTITYERRRKGHGRGRFPAHLPRTEIPLEPAENERVCSICGQDCRRIREEVTERAGFIPGYWKINRYLRGVWACRSGCGISMAELPPTIVPKSRFEPSVAVATAVAKYGDHIPLERQSNMHARLGVEIPPSTLGDAVQSLAELHRPTVEQMETEVLAEKHLHTDDTTVTVIVENEDAGNPGAGVRKPENSKRKKRMTARMWVYLTLAGKMFFRFTEDRTRDGKGGPAEVLVRFLGCLICDEYAGYDLCCSRRGMRRACCWAHARRKFKDAFESDRGRAGRILHFMRRLFWIEAAMKKRLALRPDFGPDGIASVRQRRSKKIVDALMGYAEKVRADVLPQSPLGIALTYLLGNRAHLETFLSDPLVPIDNNAAERALRAIAVGRKNYLHFGSLTGGDTAAVLYSLIGTCKALGINPLAYLEDTTRILLERRDAPRAELTPWAWAEARAKRVMADVATASPKASA